ncbi:MAG: carboxypeptidase regulatory-like domain-containing protein, partial [Chitinophagaceae bacterium]
MIRIKTIIIGIACGLPLHLFCQSISGTIAGSNGTALPVANVVIRDTGSAGAIKEFVLARDGLYSIKLTRSYSNVVLEATANGYQKGSFSIEKLEAGKHYEWDFILNKISPVDLKEVVVKAKQRPFTIAKDTVTYNVAAYRDGSERKVQDVLKNMPGIDVNSKTGEIKYKGKQVETVKLDGEDLFADNYAIGTKNINVDMVEQVQAIENYSANPLLKGIEGGEKVALNLVLKKRKTAYNGDAEIGTGMLGKKLALDLSGNLIGIAKTMKSYATASYNNVGSNNSIFDYFSYNPGVQQIREEEFLAKKYIPDLYFDSDVDSRRMNINRERSASYHAVFKVFKKINVKTANYFVGDHIRAFQSDRTINRFNNQSFSTADFYSYSKQPWQLRSDLELKSSLTKKSLLEYVLQVRKES